VKRVGDKPLDGLDLTPLLMKQDINWPERMIFNTWAAGASVRTQTHRLDAAGKLFDMIADPGQTSPINDQQPELAAILVTALKSWRQDVYGTAADTPSNAAQVQNTKKKNNGGGGNSVDPRPIPVGYREFPITMLPARDGEPRGSVQRSSGAPNCSYFVNWTSREDRMVWLLDVHTAGNYTVTIDYTCKVPDMGSTIELSFKDAKLSGKVEPAWDPPLYTNQDTLPRPQGESQMKEFRTLVLGQVALPAGNGPLTLRAIDIPGETVMDVRRITLTLLP
jgi:hypothetical protein